MKAIVSILAVLILTACGDKADFIQGAISSDANIATYTVGKESYRIVTARVGEGSADRHLFFIGGSGCTSLLVYLQSYLAGLEGGFIVHGVEKIGVVPGGFGLGCPPEFWENYTFQQLVAHNKVALEIVQETNNVRMDAIIGVSEGGPVAIELAGDFPQIPKLVVIAAGSMTQRQELTILAQRQGHEEQLAAMFRQVEARPVSVSDRVFGMTHRYWSSVLDHDPSPTLARLGQPVLIVIGAEDENVPVASAQMAASAAKQSQLVIVPGASHTFGSSQGNLRSLVMTQISDFLSAR